MVDGNKRSFGIIPFPDRGIGNLAAESKLRSVHRPLSKRSQKVTQLTADWCVAQDIARDSSPEGVEKLEKEANREQSSKNMH